MNAMDIRPLKTEADHANAVAEIERLMDAEPGSKAFERLEALADMVDAYEAKTYPIPEPDPVDAILFRLEQQGDPCIEIRDYMDISGRLEELGWGQPNDKQIAILPAQFESAQPTDLRSLKLARTRGLERLFKSRQIPFSMVKKEGQKVGVIHTASVDWATGVGPAFLVSAALLSQNPQILPLALDAIAHYLADLFSKKGTKDGSATIEIVVEKQEKDRTKTYKKIRCPASPEVLARLAETFHKVLD